MTNALRLDDDTTFTATGRPLIDKALRQMEQFARRNDLEIVQCRAVDGGDFEIWVGIDGYPDMLPGFALHSARGPCFGYLGTLVEQSVLHVYLTRRGVGDLGMAIRFPVFHGLAGE